MICKGGDIIIKIACVEDNTLFHNQVIESIKKSAFFDIIKQIDCFISAEEFIEALENESYQILILDIELHGMNGVELSRNLLGSNKDISIIFLTSFEHYMLDAFGLNVHKYILKQDLNDKLSRFLDEIIEIKFRNRTKIILLRTYEREIALDESAIICIVFQDRHPVIYLKKASFVIIGSTLKEINIKLDKSLFIQPNNGTIINLKYLKSISTNDLILNNFTDIITISRGRYQYVKEKFLAYLMLGETI